MSAPVFFKHRYHQQSLEDLLTVGAILPVIINPLKMTGAF